MTGFFYTVLTLTCLIQTTLQYDDYRYKNAAVATDVPRCSDMGKCILEQGGSAVDAAITSLLCIGVVDPQSSGLGGGLSMVVYMNKKAQAIMALEKVPLAADPYMLERGQHAGPKAIAVPTQIMGLWEAHQRYGKLEWKSLFEPVIEMARNGYPVSYHMSTVFHHYNMSSFPEIVNVYGDDDGNLPKEGDHMTSLKYADTLEKIANHGPWEFYLGGVGKSLLKDIQDQGGIITKEDFCPCNVKASWKPVASTTLKDEMTVMSTPLNGNGLLLEYVLNILDEYDISEETFANDTSKILFYHRFLEAVKLAQTWRKYLGDDPSSKIVEKVVTLLKSSNFASASRGIINDDGAVPYPQSYDTRDIFNDDISTETSHISIVAENGDAVSVTASIGFYFGSRVYSESTGIWLNSHVTNFIYPGFEHHPNSIKPGRSLSTSTTPTVVVDNLGNVKLVTGASGGDLIMPTNVWIILRTLRTGCSLQQAVDERRFFADNQQTWIETGGYDEDGSIEKIRNSLTKMGHVIAENDMKVAVVQAILRDDLDHVFTAYCDKRKGGSPAGY